MLARGGSDARARLHRSKSATSVKQRRNDPILQESIKPETARLHALTAANVAMSRASERSSTDVRRSAELSRIGGSNVKTAIRTTNRAPNVHFSGATELRRQRSLLQTRTLNTSSTWHITDEKSCTDLSQYTAPPLFEYGTTGGYGSEPSSYRKLRKARSSLTPSHNAQSMHNMSSYSPASARTRRNVKSSLEDAEQGLKLGLKRSLSFLRGSSSNLSKAFRRAESQPHPDDEAIRSAQEHFLNDLELQRLKEKGSFLFQPKAKKQQRAFRKTVRSSRATEFGDGVSSDNHNVSHYKSISKARSLSTSLRDSWKRVFGKSNKDEFPVQQLDASRPHFREYIDNSGNGNNLDEYFIGDNDATARGSLYIPSDHDHNSLEDLDRMSSTLRSAQSMESLHSNSQSRVTSWTNSTMTGSLTARSTPIDRKRLSIIKEDGGPAQPSSSVGRHGGIDVFRNPLSDSSIHGQPMVPVDSARIYSALLKRIGQEEVKARPPHGLVEPEHSTTSFQSSTAQTFRTAPTIRAVPSEASLHTIAPDKDHREFSIGKPCLQEEAGMTPQQLAQHNENVERRRELLAQQEEQSSFFPFSDRSKPLTQRPSPFKLALRARKRSQGTSGSDSGTIFVTRPRESGDEVNGRYGMSSESIYSRGTAGHTSPEVSGHSSPDDAVDSPPITGMATINPTRVHCYPRPTPNLVQVRRTRTRSSERGEWKGWIDHQITKIDRRNSRTSTSRQSHHRERAQIDEDDTSIGGGGERRSPAKRLGHRQSPRSLGAVKVEETTPQVLSSTMNDRFPLLNIKEVPRYNTPNPTPAHQDVGGTNDENKRAVETASALQSKSSLTSFGFRKKEENSPPISTPGRLVGTCSRLRNKTASFATLQDVTPTPKQRNHSPIRLANLGQFGKNITNDTDRKFSKSSKLLGIEISNMDQTDASRPSGGEYPGNKPTIGIGGKVGRLNIAPMADLMPAYKDKDVSETTALPKMEERSENSKIMSSRRMVSNFLRSRRKNVQLQKEDSSAAGSSPVFM